MPEIDLAYGKSRFSFAFDADRFEVLGTQTEQPALSDINIGARLEDPIDSKQLEELISPGESVLIVVPDATRRTGSGQIVNLLVRRLIAAGTMPFEISIIFATGIHRTVTDAEKREILTPFIAQRIKTIDHHARDLMALAGLASNQFVDLGETSSGIPIKLNRALTEHDHLITVGGVTFHYFAGFTGGRKLICPGLAAEETVAGTHALAFDCRTRSRRAGVDTARLEGNAVHEAFMEAAGRLPPTFAINTLTNERGEAAQIFCGDWIAAHRRAAETYLAEHTIEIPEKRDLVIVGCGGFPHDINMIQAHKALDMAARACGEGGTIVFLAECADGLGRGDFLDWFAADNSEKLAERLCEKYQVNGQTAWSLLKKAEQFNIRFVSSLPQAEARRMRLHPARSLEEALTDLDTGTRGYILPFGAKFLINP